VICSDALIISASADRHILISSLLTASIVKSFIAAFHGNRPVLRVLAHSMYYQCSKPHLQLYFIKITAAID